MRKVNWFVVIGLLVMAVTFYGAGPKEKTIKPVTPQIGEFTGEIVDGVRVIKLEAFRYAFKPGVIVVKKGEKVRIIAKSKDVTHGIKIKEYKIDQQLPPNQEKIIEFVADRAGKFNFACSVFCGFGHMKMHGKLIVKE